MHLAYIWIVFHLSAKNYRNWWKFDEVLTKTNLLSFFWDTVYFGELFSYVHEKIHALTQVRGSHSAGTLLATSKPFRACLGRSFLMNIVQVLQRIIVSRPTLPDHQYVSAVRILDTELYGVGLRVAGLVMMIVVDVLPPGRSSVRRDAIARREFGRNKRAMVSCL